MNETLQSYLREISRHPLLTPAQEILLGNRIQAGESDFAQVLVLSNLRFVVSVAKDFHPKPHRLMDLINEGNLGLMRAALTFNPVYDLRFTSYAIWWIRKYIFQYINRDGSICDMPLRKGQMAQKARAARNKITNRLGREPSIKEIAKAIGEDEADVQEVLVISQERAGLDTSETRQTSTPAYDDSKKIVAQELRKHILMFPERTQTILALYYGMDGGEELSFQAIGDLFHLSREAIRQIHKNAIDDLRRKPEIQEMETEAP